jgi:hypothetical protein
VDSFSSEGAAFAAPPGGQIFRPDSAVDVVFSRFYIVPKTLAEDIRRLFAEPVDDG